MMQHEISCLGVPSSLPMLQLRQPPTVARQHHLHSLFICLHGKDAVVTPGHGELL